jgi:hypothetical protein
MAAPRSSKNEELKTLGGPRPGMKTQHYVPFLQERQCAQTIAGGWPTFAVLQRWELTTRIIA